MCYPVSTTTREEALRTMCREIAVYIGEQVSPGLGAWPEAWEMVREASDEFDAAGRRWIEQGHEGGYQDTEQAGIRLVEAWQRADEAFRQRDFHVS